MAIEEGVEPACGNVGELLVILYSDADSSPEQGIEDHRIALERVVDRSYSGIGSKLDLILYCLPRGIDRYPECTHIGRAAKFDEVRWERSDVRGNGECGGSILAASM